MKFRIRRRARRLRALREEADDRDHIAWARELNEPRHRRRADIGPWRAEDEELLLNTYGKSSWELAEEAEKGYDLAKIRHQFTGADHRRPCQVCSGPMDSWPHRRGDEPCAAPTAT